VFTSEGRPENSPAGASTSSRTKRLAHWSTAMREDAHGTSGKRPSATHALQDNNMYMSGTCPGHVREEAERDSRLEDDDDGVVGEESRALSGTLGYLRFLSGTLGYSRRLEDDDESVVVGDDRAGRLMS